MLLWCSSCCVARVAFRCQSVSLQIDTLADCRAKQSAAVQSRFSLSRMLWSLRTSWQMCQRSRPCFPAASGNIQEDVKSADRLICSLCQSRFAKAVQLRGGKYWRHQGRCKSYWELEEVVFKWLYKALGKRWQIFSWLLVLSHQSRRLLSLSMMFWWSLKPVLEAIKADVLSLFRRCQKHQAKNK